MGKVPYVKQELNITRKLTKNEMMVVLDFIVGKYENKDQNMGRKYFWILGVEKERKKELKNLRSKVSQRFSKSFGQFRKKRRENLLRPNNYV